MSGALPEGYLRTSQHRQTTDPWHIDPGLENTSPRTHVTRTSPPWARHRTPASRHLLVVTAGGGDSVHSIVNQTAGVWPDPIRHLRLIFAEFAGITAGPQAHVEQLLTQ